jgi:putative thioredoxin
MELLSGLPRDIREEPEAVQLRSLLDFASSVQSSPSLAELEKSVDSNPDDLETRYQLGACYVINDRMEDALETFMYILQRDRGFRDDIGRKSLLAVFELLGNEGELVTSYRRRLFTAMH